MQQVVVQLGRRLAMTTMATLNNPVGTATDSLRQQKKALRTVVRRELRNFSPEAKRAEDEAIQQHVLSAEWYQRSKRICAYVSCAKLREVETSHILADLLEKQRRFADMKVYVPRIVDKESHMRMLHITNTDDDLIANDMNILEPNPLDSLGNLREEDYYSTREKVGTARFGHKEIIDIIHYDVMQTTEPLDLLLLPGLAFDQKGGRLGRGGGYYDLLLENYLLLAKNKGWKSPLLVALSYSPQIRDEAVPVDATDVKIDALVSSNGIRTFNSQAEEQINSSQC